jgi:hypothetical protein
VPLFPLLDDHNGRGFSGERAGQPAMTKIKLPSDWLPLGIAPHAQGTWKARAV